MTMTATDESQAKKPKLETLGTLTYFPLLAKGLAPALCAELSGLSWKGNKDTGFTGDKWAEIKASGKPPFGQLPILETPGGRVIGQATAICNYIGHVAGTEGKDPDEFAMSQMLIAEGEDLIALMGKHQPTSYAKDKPDHAKFWEETLPLHMLKLNQLINSTSGSGFTSSKTTPGELYLFAMLHQLALASAKPPNQTMFREVPALEKFYEETKALPGVAKVLTGQSAMGNLNQYFMKEEPKATASALELHSDPTGHVNAAFLLSFACACVMLVLISVKRFYTFWKPKCVLQEPLLRTADT